MRRMYLGERRVRFVPSAPCVLAHAACVDGEIDDRLNL